MPHPKSSVPSILQPAQMTRTVLDNGVVLLIDHRPTMSSVALNLTFNIGSRHEPAELSGITHFVEHMVFKGTKKRNLDAIARVINEQGGFFNASTGTDCMRLETRVVQQDVIEAVELMTDLAFKSIFPKREVERERGVILEEIAEYRDSPEDQCFDEWMNALWSPSSLGAPILGRTETIESITAAQLKDWLSRLLHPSQIIVSMAGNFTPAQLEFVVKTYSKLKPKADPLPQKGRAQGREQRIYFNRPLEQVQFCLGHEAHSRNHPNRLAAQVADIILGGGMGSRLFNEIREKRGLAYTIASTYYGMAEEGYFLVYGSTLPDKYHDVLSICQDECQKLGEEGPESEELRTAKQQFTRLILLSQDSPSTFAGRNSDREVYRSEHLSDEQLLQKIDQVNREDVMAAALEIFSRPCAVTLVGPVEE
ncbi:MAG: M16 family metallopeptidase [Sumerlaeia bacterium]